MKASWKFKDQNENRLPKTPEREGNPTGVTHIPEVTHNPQVTHNQQVTHNPEATHNPRNRF